MVVRLHFLTLMRAIPPLILALLTAAAALDTGRVRPDSIIDGCSIASAS